MNPIFLNDQMITYPNLVVAGVVLVFLFGFKQPDDLKFKKSSTTASDKKPKKKEVKVRSWFIETMLS